MHGYPSMNIHLTKISKTNPKNRAKIVPGWLLGGVGSVLKRLWGLLGMSGARLRASQGLPGPS